MNLQLFGYALAALCSLLAAAYSQNIYKHEALNSCTSKQTCGECIQTKACAWCSQPKFDGPRCFHPSHGQSLIGGCPQDYMYNPDNEFDPVVNKPLTKAGSKAGSNEGTSAETEASAGDNAAGKVVQISPQKVHLKLRRNEAQKISIKYSQAQDYPLDLYYLMDLSKSMEDDKEKLSALGDLLSNTMRKITSNFRLGFGSFVDKVVMPYVSTVPKNLESPCQGCVRPYGFRNDMSLNDNTSRFVKAVNDARVSGNLDAPEGGFDAIMQAVVCPQIGWREKARRLLVFSTDAGFHYAGDGKLGGIVEPNDGVCHLNKDNEYVFHDIQDYPSVSQLNVKVKENGINVIFAVTQEQSSVYEQLQQLIEGSSSGVLSKDSSNVVDFIKEQYDRITSAVEMKDNSKGAVQVSYYSSCHSGPYSTLVETNKCDGLKVGDMVEFAAQVMVTECPVDPKEWKQTFQIYPVGISENITVELEMLCDCPCEQPNHSMYAAHSPECSGTGTLACGVCKCDPGHIGRRCECSADGGGGGGSVDPNACRPPNSTGEPECHGRGHCVCDQCECDKLSNPDEEITGQYCECDNFSCDRNRNMLCSGPDHGTCVCGQCSCKPGWSGPACDCRALNDTCIAPESKLVCNGHGSCHCGLCTCNNEAEGEALYSGPYCSTCVSCSGRCLQYKECVLCQHYKQGMSEELCNATCKYDIIPVKTVIEDKSKGEYMCTYFDKDNCRYSFKYYLNEANQVVVEVQEELNCPPNLILIIVLGVIAAIVLVGLALLILWKIVTSIQDKREFERFEKQRAMANWNTGENPIYVEATSTYRNPAYEEK